LTDRRDYNRKEVIRHGLFDDKKRIAKAPSRERGVSYHCRRFKMKKIYTMMLSMFFLFQINSGAIAEDKTILYAFDKDYPPFTFMENGKPVGFDIEVLAAALKDKNVNMEYKPLSWGDAQEALKQGKVHVTSGMAKKEDRKKIYDFSHEPYSDLKITIFTTKKSNIRNLKDLKDKKVTTQKDSLY
jgi:ABC-type amino acid transport substrate-binding protein